MNKRTLLRHGYSIKHTTAVGWWVDGASGLSQDIAHPKIKPSRRQVKPLLQRKSVVAALAGCFDRRTDDVGWSDTQPYFEIIGAALNARGKAEDDFEQDMEFGGFTVRRPDVPAGVFKSDVQT